MKPFRSPGTWCVLASGLVLATLATAPARGETAHVLYMLQCQGCHLPDGSGQAGSVPSLRGSIARFLALPDGRAYLVQVPGSASSRLSDAELAAVLNWMAQAFGPAAAAAAAVPYTEAEVAAHRRTPLDDVAPARAALLERMGP